ncbi:MAG: RlmE family RNA methyltransferase [Gammaproteobacteria bacterium]
MTRASRSRQWRQTQAADAFAKRARAAGYRSRAAYKLMDIDDRDRLLRKGTRVLDLGAAPGGWSQVAAERTAAGEAPKRPVVAIDRLAMVPIPGVVAIEADLYSDEAPGAIEAALERQRAGLVLCDMAPNITGVKVADQAAAAGLWALALDVAGAHLAPGGDLLIKVFEGAELAAFRHDLELRFAQVYRRKPTASRSQSSEHYLLARRFEG